MHRTKTIAREFSLPEQLAAGATGALKALAILAAALVLLSAAAGARAMPPNILIILADDLGYGDLGAYGGSLIQTPHIDALASAGARLTQFYTSGNVCTPSRAGMLTGRYPIRTGLADRTLGIGDARGLKPRETTMGELLKARGYSTGLIGKWHLGDSPQYHPLEHGFDTFFGILYSNDEPKQALLRGREAVASAINPQMLAVDFIRESLKFIEKNQNRPFFLLLSMTSPHKPLLPSPDFAGQSSAGAYGDVVEELDWGVGQVMRSLQQHGLQDNTLVIFTSDNGPFPQGSTGGLPGGKGTAWEGGYRVPFIAHWPEGIKRGTVSTAMAMNIDILPSLLAIAGEDHNGDPEFDGRDITALFSGEETSPHQVLYFFNNERIAALRTPAWRLMLSDYPPWRDAQPLRFEDRPNLYTLLHDMSQPADQQYDMSRDEAAQMEVMEDHLRRGRATLESLSTQPDSTQYGDSYGN
jgi:arylsulfatase A